MIKCHMNCIGGFCIDLKERYFFLAELVKHIWCFWGFSWSLKERMAYTFQVEFCAGVGEPNGFEENRESF